MSMRDDFNKYRNSRETKRGFWNYLKDSLSFIRSDHEVKDSLRFGKIAVFVVFGSFFIYSVFFKGKIILNTDALLMIPLAIIALWVWPTNFRK